MKTLSVSAEERPTSAARRPSGVRGVVLSRAARHTQCVGVARAAWGASRLLAARQGQRVEGGPRAGSGAAVAVAGPIGFVGLVVPHVVRRLVTEDIRLALPLAAPVGALALVLADIAARTLVAPQELATGAMTALVGAPLFIFIAARFFK